MKNEKAVKAGKDFSGIVFDVYPPNCPLKPAAKVTRKDCLSCLLRGCISEKDSKLSEAGNR